MANKVVKYFIEAKEELQKVTWPTRKETTRYTIIVIASTVLLALYFGVVDFGLQKGLEGLINLSGVTTSPTQSQPFDINDLDIQPVIETGDVETTDGDIEATTTIEEGDAAEETTEDSNADQQ